MVAKFLKDLAVIGTVKFDVSYLIPNTLADDISETLFEWKIIVGTAGDDSCLSHRKLLGFECFGSVHEVGFREIFTNAHVDSFFSR